jgi:hypothetical protein
MAAASVGVATRNVGAGAMCIDRIVPRRGVRGVLVICRDRALMSKVTL